jgi:RNA polymerase sigma-70 factor, ECF subfamily
MSAAADPQAFRALYDRHRDDVWRYAVRRLADRDAAEDATTEVFMVAWRRPAAVPAADPLPWLYGVARRVLANQRRADRRRRDLGAALASDAAGAHATDGDVTELVAGRQSLRAALAALTESDREVLMLVAWEGLSIAEAAVALGCRRSAAGVRLHRARKRLRAALDRQDAADAATFHPALPTPSSR